MSLRTKRSNPKKTKIDCYVARAPRNDKESGNALIFILIAIALLGLLTVTLSRSGDSTNDTGDFEQNQIAASEILSYAKSIENAVQMLLARGCSENDISFWHDSDGNGTEDGSDDYYNPNSPTDRSCHVFDVAGTGLTYRSPSPLFSGALQITDVETSRAELLFILEDQSSEVCNQINNLSGAPVIDEVYSTPTLFTGNFSNASAVGTSGETEGATTACFTDTNTSTNALYHVLHAR